MNAALEAQLSSLYRDCCELTKFIAHAREEIAAIGSQNLTRMKLPRAGQELDAIVKMTEEATNVIMESTEEIMATENADAAVQNQIQDACLRIFEACSFQDITGQRVSKVVQTLATIEERLNGLQKTWGTDMPDMPEIAEPAPSGEAALLNGPALAGEGIDQSAVDALLSGHKMKSA